MSAETYITAMLGGANTPTDLKNHAALRLRRLREMCGDPIAHIPNLSLGELAALSWVCEMVSAASPAVDQDALKLVDFDQFLSSPHEELSAAIAHLDPGAKEPRLDEALGGPLMSQYSKALEHPFSPAVRRDLLAEYTQKHRAGIAEGMNWLDNAAAAFPAAKTALDRFS